MKLWQGLGYYSRARNMHTTAKEIVKNMNGRFPDMYNKLIKLKGVGRYTAAAIASIAFDEAVPVVDGNVYRVLARYMGIFTPVDYGNAYNTFFLLAKDLMGKSDPGLFNQSLMELGATVCTPRKPDCDNCPVSSVCYARLNEKIDILPEKSKKTKSRIRYFNYLVVTSDNFIILKKRIQNDIWKSLFDFPLIETKKLIGIKKLLCLPEFVNA